MSGLLDMISLFLAKVGVDSVRQPPVFVFSGGILSCDQRLPRPYRYGSRTAARPPVMSMTRRVKSAVRSAGNSTVSVARSGSDS